MSNILYFGNDNYGSTSMHRAQALKRLGHSVSINNPQKAIQNFFNSSIFTPIHYRTGYGFLQNDLVKWINNIFHISPKPDIIWVNSGELFGPACLKALRQFRCPIILYNNDDPTGNRDGNRFSSLVKSLHLYDLCVVRLEKDPFELKAKGVKNILQVRMSYDEIAHQPFETLNDISPLFKSEVAFIGTWIRYENRDKFLLELIQAGLPISIWGGRWQNSSYWKTLRDFYKGGVLAGRDYVAAMQGSKICLGLLSKGNRDLHTRRSVEVPYAGGLLCAERTTEHQKMYSENIEAVFWSNANECADVCKNLLLDGQLCERIRVAGMQKVRALGVGNEDICQKILNALDNKITIGL